MPFLHGQSGNFRHIYLEYIRGYTNCAVAEKMFKTSVIFNDNLEYCLFMCILFFGAREQLI
jgi:hypothetical protein